MRWTRMILGTVGAMLALTPAAHAATFTVTGTDDISGICTGDSCTSIRAALEAAEQNGADSDTIVLAAATYTLASPGALVLNTAVVLQGQGARVTTIVAAPGARVLEIGGTSTISRLTVSGGDAGAGFGGNIFSSGTTTLDRVRVTGGRAAGGAGVANVFGTMLIENSLIDANETPLTAGTDLLENAGGGILNSSGPLGMASSLTLRNSTVARNRAYRAGAIISSGNAQNVVTLLSTTVAWNSAGGGGTGGIYNDGGLFAAGSSVVANNTPSDCGGAPASSQGWNVESLDVCGFTQDPDVRNAGNAGLAGTLVNAGGETDVLVPNVDSPVVNLKLEGCESSDQRGVQRPQGPKCDAGAVEVEYPVRIDFGPQGTITTPNATFNFSSSEGATRFECALSGPSAPTPTYGPCESPHTYDNLADASHTFHVKAFDGTVELGAATREFTINTAGPKATFTSIPPELTNQFNFNIEFSASEPNVTFECEHLRPETVDPEVYPCTSPWPMRDLGDGTHRFSITPINAAGTRGDTVTRAVTIDSVVPDPVEASVVDPTTFAFTPAEPDAAFECRLEWAAGDSGFVPCTSPRTYSGLAPGGYFFTLRTLDAAGNHADANPRAFSVAQPQEAAPTATATPKPAVTATPTPTPTPTPELGETVVVRPVSGRILVRLPGSATFVELNRTNSFPVGTEIDARKGQIQLISEPGQGKPVQKAVFYGGMFTITQGADGFVELRLSEPLAPCAKKKQKSANAAAAKPKKRKLWGDGKGKFRTRGQYSAATIRGTKWLVEDSCDGTLTRVFNGVVSVRDNVRKKTFLLRAGKSYLAKPKR